MNLARLKEPFAPKEIEWRVQRAGKNGDKMWALVLAYIDNRAIMDRLDDVCGPENWKNEFAPAPNGGVLCGLSIRINGEWVTKWDGADKTDIEATKGGLSNAMKRAGSQWGIGRYLYDLEETFVQVVAKGGKGDKRINDEKKGVKGFWTPPELPSWALPVRAKPEEREKAPVKQPKSVMFRDIEPERQEKARKRFWALSRDLFGDQAPDEARRFCGGYLTADADGKPSLTASTVEQVTAAIKALEKHQLAAIAARGPMN